MRTNYVISCWSGLRRFIDPPYEADPTTYLKLHLEQLFKIKHGLEQITLVVGKNPAEDGRFVDFVNGLPSKIEDTKIVTMWRDENKGLCLGAWVCAFEKWRGDFDNYILMEDDYVPLIDNFDNILTDQLVARPECGFICGGISGRLPNFSIGIIRSACFEKVLEINARPFPETTTYAEVDEGNFYHLILKTGWRCGPVAGYSVIALHHHHDTHGGEHRTDNQRLTTIGRGFPMFVPIQTLPSYEAKKLG